MIISIFYFKNLSLYKYIHNIHIRLIDKSYDDTLLIIKKLKKNNILGHYYVIYYKMSKMSLPPTGSQEKPPASPLNSPLPSQRNVNPREPPLWWAPPRPTQYRPRYKISGSTRRCLFP